MNLPSEFHSYVKPKKVISPKLAIFNDDLCKELGFDFSSLSLVTSASEKMPPEIFEQFEKLFSLEILDSIGSSEITYEWIANRPKEFRRGSLGKPVFGYNIKLVDDEGTEIMEPNTDGEAWISSQTTCFFY